jgi:hypothetical protein
MVAGNLLANIIGREVALDPARIPSFLIFETCASIQDFKVVIREENTEV